MVKERFLDIYVSNNELTTGMFKELQRRILKQYGFYKFVYFERRTKIK